MLQRMITTAITLVCIAGVVGGCGTFGRGAKSPKLPGSAKQKSNLTPGMVKSRVHIGKTSQLEVLETFGAPNIITRDTEGREVWTYDVHSVSRASASKERSRSGNIAAAGYVEPAIVGAGGSMGGSESSAVGQSSSSTFTLMITFDSNDVVQDYRMMSTQF